MLILLPFMSVAALLPLMSVAALLPLTAVAAELPQRGGTLAFAAIGDPPSYDCHPGTSAVSLYYLAPHYSLLVKLDPEKQDQFIGDAAESWTVSADGLVYRFKLRPNIRFHDGTFLTSSDVKASFERLRNPPQGVVSPRKSTFDDIVAIETPAPDIVEFRLRRRSSVFLGVLGNPFNCLYSAARMAQDPNYPAREVMGTGPFTFVEHVSGSHWVGRRFDGYFRSERPYLDGFRVVTMPNTTAVVNAIQGGQVMGEFRTFSPAERDRLVQTMGDRVAVQEKTWSAVLLLAFNTEKKPFDDPRVRRALSLAVDRWNGSKNLQQLVSLRLVGGTQRPGSPFAAGDAELQAMPGFGLDVQANRAEARRLLREAGQPNLTFRLANRNIPNPYTAIGVYLIDQWRQIGINVEHQQMDTAPWQASLRSGNFDAILDITNEYIDDPSLELARYLSADRVPSNPARSIDRTLDELYDRQAALTDVQARKPLIREFEQRLFYEAYTVPVLWFHRIVVLRSQVKGWTITSNAILGLDLTDIWLAP